MSGGKSKSSKQQSTVLKDASMEAIADIIKSGQARKIIVMTGAGISTAAGIPDFRSKGTGLYDNLQKFKLPYAEAIFDIDYFLEKPEPFYALAKELFPGRYLPTKTHYFINLLHKHGLLLQNFTQNIDTLERLAGLPESHLVEAHGSFASATCVKCQAKGDIDHVKKQVLQSTIPKCAECRDGWIKPDITFFGQSLPEKFYDSLDLFDQADLLIVIGTSLQVQPFASLVDAVNSDVPRLLINREPAGVFQKRRGYELRIKSKPKRDALWLGYCDAGVEKLAELLGWDKELNEMHKKGHDELQAKWIREAEAESEEPEEQPKDEATKAEKQAIDTLAEDLEKRLHVPELKEENKLSDDAKHAKPNTDIGTATEETQQKSEEVEEQPKEEQRKAEKDAIDISAEDVEERLHVPELKEENKLSDDAKHAKPNTDISTATEETQEKSEEVEEQPKDEQRKAEKGAIDILAEDVEKRLHVPELKVENTRYDDAKEAKPSTDISTATEEKQENSSKVNELN